MVNVVMWRDKEIDIWDASCNSHIHSLHRTFAVASWVPTLHQVLLKHGLLVTQPKSSAGDIAQLGEQ